MSDTTTDLADFVVTREFDAPRELVFKAMIDPEQFIKFWGPTGTHVPRESVVIEAWPGGRFEYVMKADDGSGEFPGKAHFTIVDEPETLAFAEADSGILNTSTFTDLGSGRTLVTIVQKGLPAEYRTPEAQAGFSTSLDRLAAHLATLV
jgi:uncharacterized protein YndB with AHSA1/START domain